jgi:CheY-like chemotaxis protein
METTHVTRPPSEEAWNEQDRARLRYGADWRKAHASAHRPSAAWPGGRVTRGTILVVEDDDCIAELLADLLSDEGYCVVTACDGLAALRAVEKERPAMVLSDCMMPRLDGVQFVRELRRHPATRTIPVALMSSMRPRGPLLDEIPFLPKPFDVEDVLALVARFAHGPSYAPLYGEA